MNWPIALVLCLLFVGICIALAWFTRDKHPKRCDCVKCSEQHADKFSKNLTVPPDTAYQCSALYVQRVYFAPPETRE